MEAGGSIMLKGIETNTEETTMNAGIMVYDEPMSLESYSETVTGGRKKQTLIK